MRHAMGGTEEDWTLQPAFYTSMCYGQPLAFVACPRSISNGESIT